jgi:mono/diheme cytochrome c family protein
MLGQRLILLGCGALIALAALSRPGALPSHTVIPQGDADRGELVFAAGGCASCHVRRGENPLILAGGDALKTPFGVFYAPNISPDPEHGIGGWSPLHFANAMLHGRSPQGAAYYPAFPYTSYAKMDLQEISDLFAYVQTLPESDVRSRKHDLQFPANHRWAVGLWNRLYLSSEPVISVAGAELERGRHLAEGATHCAECHTPRDALGGLDTDQWMTGAENPSGPGRIPGLTPAQLNWSAEDIAYYLETGFTPDFDVAGGQMARVVANTAKLSHADRQAIATYIKALPAVQ